MKLKKGIEHFRPYLTCKVNNKNREVSFSLFFNFYPTWDSLRVVKALDIDDDPIYDIKNYLQYMCNSWNEDASGGVTFWEPSMFLINDTLIKRVISKNANKPWKKKNFYLPFSKKLLYNLGEDGKDKVAELSNEQKVALSNMKILEAKAAKTNDLQFFIDWFQEFKIYRKGSGRKGKIVRDKALKIFANNVEEVKQNGK